MAPSRKEQAIYRIRAAVGKWILGRDLPTDSRMLEINPAELSALSP